MLQNIFSLNSVTGEIKYVVSDPRIDTTVKSISIEVSLRDHPDNPIYGQRTSQLIITLCNQPPMVERCNLGTIEENAQKGTILTGTDILIRDADANKINTIVGFEIEDSLNGLIQIIPKTQNGVTTGTVRVSRPFNYETLSGKFQFLYIVLNICQFTMTTCYTF